MNVLGISCYYHDSAACLLKKGEIVAAAEEERFNRNKHSSKFPVDSIDYCLKSADLSIRDIDYVGFYEKPFLKFERVLVSHLRSYPFSLSEFLREMPNWLDEKLTVPLKLKKDLGYDGDVLFVKHHLSHAGSAFYPSPFENAAILTSDGVGEWATTTIGEGKGNEIEIMKEIKYPNSLGLLYSAVTTFLGFRANYDEGKVMGLSSYGEPEYMPEFEEIVSISSDGAYRLDESYFEFKKGDKMYTEKFIDVFGSPREHGEDIGERHKNIAASLQKITEKALLKLAKHLYRRTKLDNLCMAGGTFLNCVANRKILDNTGFKDVFIQPAAADSGGAVGAALHIYNKFCDGNSSCNFRESGVFLGPSYSDKKIERELKMRKKNYKELPEEELIEYTAKKLAENNIVGWFQGKMEFGPRALGNRSILANPSDPDMRDKINNKVKHRESFRPFAPSVLLEDLERYGIEKDLPFMIQTVDIEDNKEDIISATHVDSTARPQTVSRERNKRYYKLLKRFKGITGLPALLNTSFNDSGKPIVCSPEDALNSFEKINIDLLVLGNYIVEEP